MSCSPPPTICSLPSWSATAKSARISDTDACSNTSLMCIDRATRSVIGNPATACRRPAAPRRSGRPRSRSRRRPAPPPRAPAARRTAGRPGGSRFHSPTEQITLSMPVSSSRLRKMTPDAVAGRCRWVTIPATSTRVPCSTSSRSCAVRTPQLVELLPGRTRWDTRRARSRWPRCRRRSARCRSSPAARGASSPTVVPGQRAGPLPGRRPGRPERAPRAVRRLRRRRAHPRWPAPRPARRSG